MKHQTPDAWTEQDAAQFSDLLILPDGRVLAHALTPTFARLLRELDPEHSHLQIGHTAVDDPSHRPHSASLPHELCPGN